MRYVFRTLILVSALLGLLAVEFASGQVTTPAVAEPSKELVTREQVQKRRDEAEKSADLDEEGKKKVLEQYDAALKQLKAAEEATQKAVKSKQAADAAPTDLAKVKQDLAQLADRPPLILPQGGDLKALEQDLLQRQEDLKAAQEKKSELEAKLANQTTRRTALPMAVTTTKEQLGEIQKQLAAPPPDEPAALRDARRARWLATRQALQAQLKALEEELAENKATQELLPLQLKLAASRVENATADVKSLQDVVNMRRREDTEKQLKAAQRDAAQAVGPVKKLALENVELAAARKKLTPDLEKTVLELDSTKKQYKDVADRFTRMKQKVADGLPEALGIKLRREKETLPDTGKLRREMRARTPKIQEVRFHLQERQDQQNDELPTLDQAVEQMMKGVRVPEGLTRKDLESAVRDFQTAHRELLSNLVADYNTYYDSLIDLHAEQARLVKEVDEYESFINERILWIRSTGLPSQADLQSGRVALAWVFDRANWKSMLVALANDAQQTPVVYVIALLVFLTIIWFQRRMRDRISHLGQIAEKANCFDFTPTAEALGLTFLCSIHWPLLLWFLSWRLSELESATVFTESAAGGLWFTSCVYLPVEFFRQMLRPNGLATSHFHWPPQAMRSVRVNLRWCLPASLVLLFFSAGMYYSASERWQSSLGRACFVGMILVLGAFWLRVLRSKGPLMQAANATTADNLLIRARQVWLPVAMLVTAAFVVLAVWGYYYTAQQLTWRLQATGTLLLCVVVTGALVMRWVRLKRRKIAIEQARKRAAALRAESEQPLDEMPAPVPEEIDLTEVNRQTSRMVWSVALMSALIGCWLVWVDVLPAVRMLGQVPLWNTIVSRTTIVEDSEGNPSYQTSERPEWITLDDVVLSLLVLSLTLIAAKNIPGMMEMLVLAHLPFDRGIRYAITTLSRYAIFLLGILVASSLVGLSWEKVQWLVAALGLGLGFGLQEIFANFVSGVVLLFERPVRVGDIVTIGDVSGTVTQIHMRATTIRTWDEQELIVPNKEFITGRLLNWTLSDPITRLQIPVGVAYGTDGAMVSQVLMKTIKTCENVLQEPEPIVTFDGFGDSTLNFTIRAYSLANRRLMLINEVHMAVQKAFREAKIEIAFPQLDLHLKDLPASAQQTGSNGHTAEGKSKVEK